MEKIIGKTMKVKPASKIIEHDASADQTITIVINFRSDAIEKESPAKSLAISVSSNSTPKRCSSSQESYSEARQSIVHTIKRKSKRIAKNKPIEEAKKFPCLEPECGKSAVNDANLRIHTFMKHGKDAFKRRFGTDKFSLGYAPKPPTLEERIQDMIERG